MPRVKLAEQLHYEFHYQVTLQVRDINYGGHLGNDAVVGLIHEARLNLLRQLGCNEMDLGDGQTGLIIGDLVVNYKAEGFMFDCLQIDSHIGEINRNSFRIFHRFTKNGEILALAETGIVTFNYQQRRIAFIPDRFINALNQFTGLNSETHG
jgi:acyl-CoA thioesterase FadM